MQFVNDDMDDVFRKAGEHYPLQVATPAWDKMEQALEAAEKKNAVAAVQQPRSIWLLLLAPFLLVCTTYFPIHKMTMNHSDGNMAKATQKENLPGEILQPKTNVPPVAQVLSQPTKPAIYTTKNVMPAMRNTTTKNNNTSILNEKHLGNTKRQVLAQPFSKSISEEQPFETVKSKENLVAGQQRLHTEVDRLNISDDRHLLQESAPGTLPKAATAAFKTKFQMLNSGLYAGLLGSFDFTSVHLQKTNRIGRQLGVVAGYRINKKWSLETGLYVAKKYYYSEGSYYKPSQIYTPPNTSIVEVDGTCAMLEIPLLLKYDFAKTRNLSLFATAGVSSYIMKKEDYNYLYYYQNTGNYAKHSKSYRNASSNLFSVVHLSGGMSRDISSTTALRVEPYVKLPVAGLGYGKMQFTSAGINMGVVQKF